MQCLSFCIFKSIPTETTMKIQEQLEALITLALIDNELSNIEKRSIYNLGKANELKEGEIDEIFTSVLRRKELAAPSVSIGSDEEKFEFLYSIVQLMKIDKKVYLSEIKFCEEMALKLGYKSQLISELSAKVFSDPHIISDHHELQILLDKYKLSE